VQRCMHRSLPSLIALLALNTACAGRPDLLVHLASPHRGESNQGAYFVDGTSLDDTSGSAIWKLANRVNPAEVRLARYYRGPKLFCDIDGELSCRERVDRLTTTICEDLRQKRISSFAVFGFSRGVWIANKAAVRVLATCPAAATPGAYVYGGFIDGVMQSAYLSDAAHIPAGTRFHHFSRNDFAHLLYPNTLFGSDSADSGANEPIVGLGHVTIGTSDWAVDRASREANHRMAKAFFLSK
jgi:hypothetical protein